MRSFGALFSYMHQVQQQHEEFTPMKKRDMMRFTLPLHDVDTVAESPEEAESSEISEYGMVHDLPGTGMGKPCNTPTLQLVSCHFLKVRPSISGKKGYLLR